MLYKKWIPALLYWSLKLVGRFGDYKKRPRQYISANLLTLGD